MEVPEFRIPAGYREAVEMQEALRHRVSPRGRLAFGRIRTVAGVDCSFSFRGHDGVGAITVHSFPDLEWIGQAAWSGRAAFPYIPGLLSFREIPFLLNAWRLLEIRPDVILCDGQGIAHPRGIGFASHLGLVLEIPTIGVAKSRLVGEFEPPGDARGESSPLLHEDREIGRVLRTRNGVKPLFVSPGHRVGMNDAVRMVLACCPRYRIPEMIRSAHRLVNRIRKDNVKGLEP